MKASLPASPEATPAATVLVVDDDPQIRRLLRDLLGPQGLDVEEAASAEEALEKLAARLPDLVLLDLHMPGRTGHDVLLSVRANEKTRLLPVVMLTGGAGQDDKLRAIAAGVTDFLSKPFSGEELATRVRSLIQLKRYTDELEHAENVIIALARTIDARDPYTAHHSERVSFFAGLLGERVGLAGTALSAVRRGGLFHDLGKIAVRDDVLLKQGELSPAEFEEMKRHPMEGRKLLEHMTTLSHALDVVTHHHEKFDGSGYPAGLAGETIPVTARVTTVADVFDALTTARVYRTALSDDEAFRIMRSEVRKGWWDPRLVDEFRAVLETLPKDARPPVPRPSRS